MREVLTSIYIYYILNLLRDFKGGGYARKDGINCRFPSPKIPKFIEKKMPVNFFICDFLGMKFKVDLNIEQIGGCHRSSVGDFLNKAKGEKNEK